MSTGIEATTFHSGRSFSAALLEELFTPLERFLESAEAVEPDDEQQ